MLHIESVLLFMFISPNTEQASSQWRQPDIHIAVFADRLLPSPLLPETAVA